MRFIKEKRVANSCTNNVPILVTLYSSSLAAKFLYSRFAAIAYGVLG